jgi:hypothetical protein
MNNMDKELENAIYEYRKAVVELRNVVERVIKSHNNKIEAVKNIAPFLSDIIKKAQK